MLAVSPKYYLRRGQSLRAASVWLPRGPAPKRNLIFLMARLVQAKTDIYNVDVNVSDIKYIDRDEVLEQSSVADSDIMMISHFILG